MNVIQIVIWFIYIWLGIFWLIIGLLSAIYFGKMVDFGINGKLISTSPESHSLA